jgi:hypothetical protein
LFPAPVFWTIQNNILFNLGYESLEILKTIIILLNLHFMLHLVETVLK